jgi:hypothetical protein
MPSPTSQCLSGALCCLLIHEQHLRCYDKVYTPLHCDLHCLSHRCPFFTGIVCPFVVVLTLILNCSSAVFTSCIFSKIEALWFSTFSHTSDSRSSTVVAINSTSSVVNDVSIGFLWALAFFLEPLACSLFSSFGPLMVQMLLASVYPCHVSCPSSSSMRHFLCLLLHFFSVHLFCCFLLVPALCLWSLCRTTL